jgi:hypothetical protein
VRGKPAHEVVVKISGVGLPRTHKVLGVDEFQALDLAMKFIGKEFETDRYSALRWHFGMNSRDLGFPRVDDQKLPRSLVNDIEAAVRQFRQKRKQGRTTARKSRAARR